MDSTPSRRPLPPLPSWTDEPDEADASARRAVIRRGLKALEIVRASFLELEGFAPEAERRLGELELQLDRLRPPEPRRCKEFRRAADRARRGFLGMDPDEVVLYCRCPECTGLRDRHQLEQKPLPPGAEDAPPPEPVVGQDVWAAVQERVG